MEIDLHLQTQLAAGYKSASQIARVLTETWAGEQLFCPNCGAHLYTCSPNTRTVDFTCPDCGEEYQLKSSKKLFHKRVLDAEYHTTLQRALKEQHPSLILLNYHQERMIVTNVLMIHRASITPSCIIPLQPLKAPARRAGWQGCWYDLQRIPFLAQVQIIRDQIIMPKDQVLLKWKTIQKMLSIELQSRGWIFDVLTIVEKLRPSFTLQDVYQYEDYLQNLHPQNHYIRPKIRQQLQFLRDMGVIEFEGRGKYLKIL